MRSKKLHTSFINAKTDAYHYSWIEPEGANGFYVIWASKNASQATFWCPKLYSSGGNLDEINLTTTN
jgi:hypothetical protein